MLRRLRRNAASLSPTCYILIWRGVRMSALRTRRSHAKMPALVYLRRYTERLLLERTSHVDSQLGPEPCTTLHTLRSVRATDEGTHVRSPLPHRTAMAGNAG